MELQQKSGFRDQLLSSEGKRCTRVNHNYNCLQISLLGRGRGELLEFSARVGEGRPVTSSGRRGETPPEAGGEAAGPRPISRPAQESHAVWLPHRKDGGPP